MDEIILMIFIVLSICTTGVMFLYYRRLKEGSREYVRAKAVLSDMVLSFNKDLEMQAQKISSITNENERASRESLQAIGEIESEMVNVKAQLKELVDAKDALLNGYDALKKNMEDSVSQRSKILERISKLESLEREMEVPEDKMMPAIPIRREKALAPLTETELRILELLATEGEKTAPQIREKVNLTREHTARLMKKLFAVGYVERRTDRMPYVYGLKKEMENLLKDKNTDL
jgi:predicted HTH transcriptional regulator